MDVDVEWEGSASERLENLLSKTAVHHGPSRDALNSHLISTRNRARLSETLSLIAGYAGLPTALQTSPTFLGFLSIAAIALLSPRDLRFIPDSAGEILRIFELRGFYRVVSGKALATLLGDSKVADDGIRFLLDSKLVERMSDDTYRLLEVPLTNVRVSWLP